MNCMESSSENITTVVIETNGTVRIDVTLRGELTKTMQQAVGGYLEAVMSRDEQHTFFVNDEGKCLSLDVNPIATALRWATSPEYRGRDVLVGPVVVAGGVDPYGDTMQVHPAIVAALIEADLI